MSNSTIDAHIKCFKFVRLCRFTTSIINVSGKSCALVYSVYGESICCLLLNGPRHHRKNESGNAKLYSHSKERMKKRADSTASDVETGLRTIRDRLVGYRYLAVQQQRRAWSVTYDFELIFRTVFRGDSGELWLCGQRRQFPSPRERVRTAYGFSYKRRFKGSISASSLSCSDFSLSHGIL